jgi:glycosyltransferase involved in cell wall biosynthesis
MGAMLPVPFIWGPVGGGQRTPKSFMEGYSFSGKLADGIRLFGQWIGRHLLITRKRCVKRARAILVCNQETKEKIPIKHRNKVQYFPVNGISTEDLAAEVKKRLSHEAFQIITAGRLIHWKNFGEAVKAFALFSQKHQDSCFNIIGEGPEVPRLKKLVEEFHIQQKVNFFSWIPRKELFQKMTESHVFLFPSLREGGGAVVVESMACGTPVICLDNAGPGFHTQEKWGIKIKPLNPDYIVNEMAAALERLHEDENFRHGLGQASRRRAEEYYVWDRLGEKLKTIYDQAGIGQEPKAKVKRRSRESGKPG